MTLTVITFIALGLAMDAFAVSISMGFTIKRLHIKHALGIALSFGLFQGIMPVIGWLAGHSITEFIEHIDHWVAFGLLAFIGIKMIIESSQLEEEKPEKFQFNFKRLFILSIATSMDALAVGLSLSVLKVSLITAPAIIGAVTFVLSFGGAYIGDKIGHLFESKLEIIGGVILILIGLKILAEHIL